MQFIYALVATYTLVAIVTIWQRDTYWHVRCRSLLLCCRGVAVSRHPVRCHLAPGLRHFDQAMPVRH
eukprot:COSAG01_NODE_54339_length_332_cov_2.081545_1_plen_66_part_01